MKIKNCIKNSFNIFKIKFRFDTSVHLDIHILKHFLSIFLNILLKSYMLYFIAYWKQKPIFFLLNSILYFVDSQ